MVVNESTQIKPRQLTSSEIVLKKLDQYFIKAIL